MYCYHFIGLWIGPKFCGVTLSEKKIWGSEPPGQILSENDQGKEVKISKFYRNRDQAPKCIIRGPFSIWSSCRGLRWCFCWCLSWWLNFWFGGCGGFLLCSEFVEPLRYEFRMCTKVQRRVDGVSANLTCHEHLSRRGTRTFSYRTIPLPSMINVTLASVNPRRPLPTPYALRASPFESLKIGY